MEHKHFTFAELLKSETAQAARLNNIPESVEVFENLHALITKVLDPVREKLGKPIYINSGYRSPQLNRLCGGVPNSQHVAGEAADITTYDISANAVIYNILTEGQIEFDQLIMYPRRNFLHVSYKRTGQNRKEVIWKRT